MADFEEQFIEHVHAIEAICDECASEHPDLAEHLQQCVDAAMPKLDDIQDDLAEAIGGESRGESGSDE